MNWVKIGIGFNIEKWDMGLLSYKIIPLHLFALHLILFCLLVKLLTFFSTEYSELFGRIWRNQIQFREKAFAKINCTIQLKVAWGCWIFFSVTW